MKLEEWLVKNYQEQDLAQMLADVIEGRGLPEVPPTELLEAAPSIAPRGRPPQGVIEERREALVRALETAYPVQVSLNFLAGATGMARQTVRAAQLSSGFLDALPGYLAGYFASLPERPKRGDMAPVWRGVLDAHYLLLMKWHNWATLDLYSAHALMWGAGALKHLGTLPVYNALERRRLAAPRLLAAYEKSIGPVQPLGAKEEPVCQTGCLVVKAYIAGSTPETVQQARDLLTFPEGLPECKWTYPRPLPSGSAEEVALCLLS